MGDELLLWIQEMRNRDAQQSPTPKHASINLMVCIGLSLEGLMPVQLRSLQHGHRLETEHGLQDAMRCDENTM